MAWETRKGGRYFYTKEREGNRVVSRYVGKGETAQLIGQFSALRHMEEQARRADMAAEIEAMKREDEEADELFAMVEALMRAELTAAGFHQHKRGEWRRKRCQQKNQPKHLPSRSKNPSRP